MNPENSPQYPASPTPQQGIGQPVQQQVPAPAVSLPVAGTPPAVTPGAPQPNSQSPYDFIVNPAAQPKKSPFSGGGNALRLLTIVAGGALLVIVLGIVLANVLSKNDSPASLTSLAQQQQELIRVAALGESQASTETTSALAYTVDLAVGSSQNQLLVYLSGHGTKLKANQLSLAKDTTTDKQLSDAQASGTYDSALQKVLTEQLQSYISNIQKAYKQARTTQLKQVLSANFNTAKTLLSQAQNTPSNGQ